MSDENVWVALSASDPAPEDLVRRNLSHDHLDLAFVELTRYLLSVGRKVAYGGDLRLRGFTDQLFDLIRSYRLPGAPEVGDGSARRARIYLAASLYDAASKDALAAARNVAHVLRVAAPSVPSYPHGERVQLALELVEMRRRVTAETGARVVIGGRLLGASGRAPGVLEEAWFSARARQPLYVLGGFGGVGALIGAALLGRDVTPERLAIEADPGYIEMAGAVNRLVPEQRVGASMMLDDIVAGGIPGLRNGLDASENERLFESDSIDETIGLILRGLAAR